MSAFWIAAIAASAGAGIIHLALGPEHVEELGGLGLGFYLAAALQLGWSIAVAMVLVVDRAPRLLRGLAVGGVGINAAILAAWAISRLVGLPAGEAPWMPEAVGRPDAVAAVLEGGLTLGLGIWLRGASVTHPLRSIRRSAAAALLAIAVIGAGTAYGLTGDGPTHGVGESHEPAGEAHTH